MNNETIEIRTGDRSVKIPNRWELLTADQYLFLVALITQFALKTATAHDVRFHYVCHVLGVQPSLITDSDAMSNLIVIADQVDFIFDSSGKINLCFLAQLLPVLRTKKRTLPGYSVNTSFGTLTCSLTASQFIDAYELLNASADKLPLLSSILYCPRPYSSEKAHTLAKEFKTVHPYHLQAVSMNFQALLTYLFTQTHFSLLSTGKKGNVPEIATGMAETMYNLSVDGMGDVSAVKQMPIIEFLTILRKKIIESVKAMHDAKIDILKISESTGLPIHLVKKML